MIIGVMSDTHGNSRLMQHVAAEMVQRFEAGLIFHLGDDYADSEELILSGYPVRRVPGLWCAEYHDARIPNRIIDAVDGLQVSCAHAEKDLRGVERAAAIVLTGHTHVPNVSVLARSLYVNPGHLKSAVNRNQQATYAIIEIGPEEVCAAIRDAMTGSVLWDKRLGRAEIG